MGIFFARQGAVNGNGKARETETRPKTEVVVSVYEETDEEALSQADLSVY